jgi:hypothetical protein
VSYGLPPARPGFEILLKPTARQLGNLIQRARFFKQMGGSGNDLQLPLRSARESRDRLAVQADDHLIVSPDNEQTWRQHSAERLAGKIRPSSAGHNRLRHVRTSGCRGQSRRRASAGPEVTKPEFVQILLPANPVRNGRKAPGEKVDIETKFRCSQIGAFLVFSKKVDQDCAYSAAIEDVSYVPISGTMTTAAAPVREKHKACCAFRQREIGRKVDLARRHFNSHTPHAE